MGLRCSGRMRWGSEGWGGVLDRGSLLLRGDDAASSELFLASLWSIWVIIQILLVVCVGVDQYEWGVHVICV